jgi:hypothetical protein
MHRPRLAQALGAALLFLERWVWLAPLVGVLLALPAIGSERVFDDHVLELVARQSTEAVAPGTGLDLFRFANGRVSDNLALMAEGSMLPWWTDPELKISFYRPLSSLLHRLDYALWPSHPELMYGHTLLWFGVLCALVVRLYARFEPRAAVGSLAAWLYAVNDAHGTVVGWLSNRNALVSAVFAVATLLAHDRARRDGHEPSRLWAPLWLGFALLSGELGAGTWALLLAYTLALESGPLQARVLRLWPFVLVTLGWAILYLYSGAGTYASGVYLHPLWDLPAFAVEFPRRALVLLGAAFGPIPAELSFLGPSRLMPLWIGSGGAWLVACAWIGRREVGREPIARFWLLAVGFGVVPVSASFSSDRLLILVNLGAMALVARVVVGLVGGLLPSLGPPASARASDPGALALGFGAALLGVHALLGPLLLPVRAHQMQELARATQHAFTSLDDIDDISQKTLIVLGAPTDFFISYLQAERAAHGLSRPEHVYWLANPEARLALRVLDEHTLSLERDGGFFVAPPEALYRKRSAALAMNDRVSLPELTATVRGMTSAGMPSRVEFSFDQPMTDGRFVFLALRGCRYERVAPGDLDRLQLEPAPPLAAFLVPHALNPCRVRSVPAARVRGGSNPARWASLHPALPLHREKPGADFGFLPLGSSNGR